MSVLKGEGKVPILYGSTTFAVVSRSYRGYLARPDLSGEWPTIVLVPSAWGVTSNVKDMARRIARQGFAVVAQDLFHGEAPNRSVPANDAEAAFSRLPQSLIRRELDDIVAFVRNPSGFWSSAEHGFGVLGLGRGGTAAAQAAAGSGAAALALAGTPLDGIAATLDGYLGGMLGLFGREDERTPAEAVAGLRGALPRAELVVYSGASSEFWDDYQPSFDDEVAADALERLSEFFAKHLPPPPA